MDIQIRQYKDTDKEAIMKLFEEFHDYIMHIDPIKRLRRMPGFAESYTNKTLKDVQEKQGVFFIATENEKIIGFIVALILKQTEEELLEVIPSVIGRITELYIDALHRQKGLGTTLIKKAECYLIENSCDVIWIDVFEPNTPAHTLYKKLGYNDRNIDMIKKIK